MENEELKTLIKQCLNELAAEKAGNNSNIVFSSLSAEEQDRVREEIINEFLKTGFDNVNGWDEEKIKACELAKEAEADYVKTSTGFSAAGARTEDVALMRKTVGNEMGVKASGGIRNRETAMAMVNAGASRLGTSATVAICR